MSWPIRRRALHGLPAFAVASLALLACASAARAQTVTLVCPWWAGDPPQQYKTVYIIDMSARTVRMGPNVYDANITDEYITRAEPYPGGGVYEKRINCVTGDLSFNHGGRTIFGFHGVTCQRAQPVLP